MTSVTPCDLGPGGGGWWGSVIHQHVLLELERLPSLLFLNLFGVVCEIWTCEI